MSFQPQRFRAAQQALFDRWGVPVERIELESAHGTTAVAACGPRDGAPLVLLHGGGGATAAVWYANAAALSGHRRLYAVDRIGEAGASRAGERPIRSPADLADWLDTVLDGLALNRTDLLGHSYGARIALDHALGRPQRVRRLVLLDPTLCFTGYRVGYLLRAAPLLLRPTAERALGFLRWETGGLEPDPAWAELQAAAAGFPGTRPVVGKRPKPALLATLRVPTLIALADRSRAHDPRAVQAAARRLLPSAVTVMLPDVSHHALPYHHPRQLNELVEEFLAQP